MNIKYLEYLVTIVDNNFNITKAAEMLHISQPALSNFIRRFEAEVSTEVFVRQNRKLTSLTKTGEILFQDSVFILESYNKMMNKVERTTQFKGGKLRIGINPIMLSGLFTGVLKKISNNNPNVKLQIIEKSSRDLLALLDQNDLDIVFTFHPNDVSKSKYSEKIIYEETLMGFINSNHPLANRISEKNTLKWKDLDEQKVALFDKNFYIRNFILNKYKENNVHPNITLESGSWDFLLENVRHNDLVTFMPSIVKESISMKNLRFFNMDTPIPWTVSLVYPAGNSYNETLKYFIDSLVKYFIIDQEIKEFRQSSDK